MYTRRKFLGAIGMPAVAAAAGVPLAPLRLNPEMVEEIQCSREPLDATPRSLGDRRQPP